jgi:hypothetical protein
MSYTTGRLNPLRGQVQAVTRADRAPRTRARPCSAAPAAGVASHLVRVCVTASRSVPGRRFHTSPPTRASGRFSIAEQAPGEDAQELAGESGRGEDRRSPRDEREKKPASTQPLAGRARIADQTPGPNACPLHSRTTRARSS